MADPLAEAAAFANPLQAWQALEKRLPAEARCAFAGGAPRRPRRSPYFTQCSTSRITLQRGFFSTAVLPVTQ